MEQLRYVITKAYHFLTRTRYSILLSVVLHFTCKD